MLDHVRVSWLDARLGLRMVRKYPALSLVSVMGMSMGIAIAAGIFGIISLITAPRLPLDEGDRVVSIRNWDVRSNQAGRITGTDFVQWDSGLVSIPELGAFRWGSRNLFIPNRAPQVVQVAEMTSSGFRLARVRPELGRPLMPDDERSGAPPVVVIAYEEWQRHFDGVSDILGRTLRLGNTTYELVGVMPKGFRFPLMHRYWIPLPISPVPDPDDAGSFHVFGRLAPGASIDRAQAELTTIGMQMSASFPTTHERLRPRVMSYTYPFLGVDNPTTSRLLRSLGFFASMVLVLIAVNVAVLVYARTATRTGEIAVRTALGASRRRIVAQLFIEALVLSVVAAVVGIALTAVVFAVARDILWAGSLGELPFWFDLRLSLGTVLYVATLAILTGVIVGVLPALKATGRKVQANLQQIAARGSQMQLGRTWTTMIIAQVAVAMGVLPLAVYQAGQSLTRASVEPAYAAGEFLRAQLTVERGDGNPRASESFRRASAEFLRALESEPAVSGMTFVSNLAGYPFARMVDEEGTGAWAFINRVDFDHFSVLDVPILAGRGFVETDSRRGSNVVIINREFAERLSGSGNVLGRRIRYVEQDDGRTKVSDAPWLEIVGVVPDYSVQGDLEPPHARLYQPVALADVAPGVTLSLRLRGIPAPAFTRKLRDIATTIDPTLQLTGVQSAADFERTARRFLGLIALTIVAVVLSVVLLSAAGIYAMMSFTVARRRREIGIRSALGADGRRLLTGIFARASGQLAWGVLVGLVLAAVLQGGVDEKGLVLLPLVAVFMLMVGLLAALGPARRGLAIQPTEALREE